MDSIKNIEELKTFAKQPMPHIARGGLFKGDADLHEMRKAQAELPNEIEISKDVASFLVTHYVDGKMREEEARRRYKPGLSFLQFAASALFSFMTGNYGFHNAQAAYTAYKNIQDYNDADRAMEPSTEKVMNSYRVEGRMGDRYFLMHGATLYRETYSSPNVYVPAQLSMTNVGLGEDPSKVTYVDKLYDSRHLNLGSKSSGGRSR